MPEPHVGMMVTPTVRLDRPLGEGGMGAVWVADHLALHVPVVVKFIAEDLAKHPEARARFSREAAMAAQVKSPHVVQTLDYGITDEGRPYIVMELLEGSDLGTHLEAVGRMAPLEVVNVVTQLARALDRAHARGIVHRDIKPNNIFLCDVDRNGEIFVKLLDFGIAKGDIHAKPTGASSTAVASPAGKVDGRTKTGSLMGTPFYMSPEQLLGAKDIDYRTDLWSVGVVAFEALTGAKPFDADTIGGIAVKAHSEPLPRMSALRTELPDSLDAWFERACARNPRERFASTKEMADALALAATGHAPAASIAGALGAPVAHAAHAEPRVATNAGVVRSEIDAGAGRGRWLLGAAALAAVIALGFVAPRLFRPSAPSAARGASAPIAPADGDAKIAAGVSASTAPAVPSSSVVAAVAAPAVASVASAKAVAPADRRPSSRPPVAASVTPHAAASAAPATVATTTPVPRPTASGNDIF